MPGLDDVLERLVNDAGFRGRLAADPAGALAGYDLSSADLALLASQVTDGAGASGAVEARTSRASLVGFMSAFGDIAEALSPTTTDLAAGASESPAGSAFPSENFSMNYEEIVWPDSHDDDAITDIGAADSPDALTQVDQRGSSGPQDPEPYLVLTMENAEGSVDGVSGLVADAGESAGQVGYPDVMTSVQHDAKGGTDGLNNANFATPTDTDGGRVDNGLLLDVHVTSTDAADPRPIEQFSFNYEQIKLDDTQPGATDLAVPDDASSASDHSAGDAGGWAPIAGDWDGNPDDALAAPADPPAGVEVETGPIADVLYSAGGLGPESPGVADLATPPEPGPGGVEYYIFHPLTDAEDPPANLSSAEAGGTTDEALVDTPVAAGGSAGPGVYKLVDGGRTWVAGQEAETEADPSIAEASGREGG
jgi:hypothetical protein